MSGDGVEGIDRMVVLTDVSSGPDVVRLMRDVLERAGIHVDVRTWGGPGRWGMMASVLVPESELEAAEQAVAHLLDRDAVDPTDADAYWNLATVGNAADAELLTSALADVGIGSMSTHIGERWDQTIGVLRVDLADAVRLARRLADRAPTLELDPELEDMKLTRSRIPDKARRKQRRRIRRW